MSAKDKFSNKVYGNSDATEDDNRYKNFNLNETSEFSDKTKFPLVSSSSENGKAKEHQNEKYSSDGYSKFSYSVGSTWKSNERDSLNKLKTLQSPIIGYQKEEIDKYYLSHQIARYEAAFDFFIPAFDNGPHDSAEARIRLMNKLITRAKTASKAEFPRQQKTESTVPEIMQFKASQRLLNPNSTASASSRKRGYPENVDNQENNNVPYSDPPPPPPPTPSPSSSDKRKTFTAPSLPRIMTTEELENFQYDEPELREWQEQYFQGQTPQEPHKETLEEEVIRLRRENKTLREENLILKGEKEALKKDLRKIKNSTAQRDRRARNKIKEPKNFENYERRSQNNIINDIWKKMVKTYGSENASNIVNAIHKRQEIREKEALTPLETLQLLKSSGITISALRGIRSLLKEFGVKNPFASEAAVNAQRAALHKSVKMVKKTVLMDGKNGEKVATEVYTIGSVETELKERLTTLIKAGNYEPWYHNGVEEVPCVFTGDKGKDFTTVVMGVGSTKNPRNSPNNCSKLGYFKGNDSQANLYDAFGDPDGLAEQIDKIKEVEIEIDGVTRKFKIRWFVLGDFKFLNAIAGLNTNAASFPCWGCVQKQESTYSELDLNQTSPERVMEINKSLSQIREPLFKSIPFDHYIPPILHITLGPGAQLFEAVCERAREIDAAELNESDVAGMLPTEKVRKSWESIKENIERLKDEIEEINHTVTLYQCPPDEDTSVCDSSHCFALQAPIEINNICTNENYCTECSSYFHKCCLYKGNCPNCVGKTPTSKQSQDIIDKQLKELEKKLKQTSKLLKEEEDKAEIIVSKFKLGRLATNVEKVYEKFGGSRKAFFQEFTGKQLNQMGSNIHAIYAGFDKELKDDPKIQKIVRGIIQFFNIKKLLSTQMLSDEETNDIEEAIKDFAAYMKLNLPEMRVKQKGHSFFKHLPKFIKKFHIAAYFIDECIESFHVVTNKYMRRIGNRSSENCALLLFKYNKEDTWLHDTFSNVKTHE